MADCEAKNGGRGQADGRSGLAAPPFSRLDDPLGFLDADHVRQRSLCRTLLRLSAGEQVARDMANRIVMFMTHDLPLHHLDEEEDLFPLLLKRAQPDDCLVPILTQLSHDHVAAAGPARRIVAALSLATASDRGLLDKRSADIAQEYACSEQRHLSIESAIVMVLARKRLKAGDLQAMARSMKARRGVGD
ncbi:MAG: hemerythrin domain-containing protein [Hyphomicrobiaceae bacterium]